MKPQKVASIDVADGISLPIDFVTARVALLGMSGAGKSNGFSVMVEGVYDVGAAFTFIDPLGAAYGMRSSADGDGPGLLVPIMGGYHADLPLRPDSGALIARELYKLDASAVLDLSAFTPAQQCVFVADHCDELLALHLRHKKVRAVFADEAGRLAPQRPASDADARCATSLWRLHTGGRGIGIGLKTATQSSAEQDKRTIKQAEMIVALRVFSPLDQKPVIDYVNTTVEKPQAEDIKRSLAKLKDGEAWFIAPQWLGEVRKARFRLRRTFDSSATPKLGQVAREPRVIAKVDLEKIRVAIERNRGVLQSDDPAALRAEIDRLTVALRDKSESTSPEIVEVRVEVPVLSKEAVEALTRAATATSDAAATLVVAIDTLKSAATEISTSIDKTRALPTASTTGPMKRQTPPVSVSSRSRAPRENAARIPAPRDGRNTEGLRAGAVRMLQELARCGGVLSKAQLSTLAEVKKGGTFSQYLRALVNRLYVEDGGSSVRILATGAAAIGETIRTEPQTTQEIVARYAPKLRAGANRMLELLVRAYPREIEKDILSESADVKKGGTFSQYLRALINNGLASEDSKRVRASDTLFMKPR